MVREFRGLTEKVKRRRLCNSGGIRIHALQEPIANRYLVMATVPADRRFTRRSYSNIKRWRISRRRTMNFGLSRTRSSRESSIDEHLQLRRFSSAKLHLDSERPPQPPKVAPSPSSDTIEFANFQKYSPPSGIWRDCSRSRGIGITCIFDARICIFSKTRLPRVPSQRVHYASE